MHLAPLNAARGADDMPVIYFLIYLVTGVGELWLLLFFWGFSGGPANAVPFVTLVGCLVLMLAAALALFFKRLSALVALVGAALALTWPVAAAFDSSIFDVLALALSPVVALGIAAWRIRHTRQSRWLAAVSTPSLWVRIVLLGVAMVLLVRLINMELVLGLFLPAPSQ